VRIATWNINSVRSRKRRLLDWLRAHQPDLLCLQELKAPDDQFPHLEVRAAGYRAAVHGQRGYNGVAILARDPLCGVTTGFADGGDDSQARLVSAVVGGVRVVCVYVPNGDFVGSKKWVYKLEWLDRLRQYLERTARASDRLVLCGDFNVAPDDADVSEPARWGASVLCHADARARLARILDWGLFDAFRQLHPHGGEYTWWDYRFNSFARNSGLRIDLMLATGALQSSAAHVDRDERAGEGPSDHAPVVVELS
jgi:exodeoxyribonuclease-3